MESTIFDGTTEEKCKNNNNNETGTIRKEDADPCVCPGMGRGVVVVGGGGGHAQTRKCFVADGHEKKVFWASEKRGTFEKHTKVYIRIG